MKKIIFSILAVLLIALLTVSVTYSFFLSNANGNNQKVASNSSGYNIIFTKVSDFDGELDPTTERNEDVYSVVKMKVTSNTARVNANLYINIENISSSIATGALTWEVVATKGGNSVTISPSSGNFASCDHNGTIGACQSGDKLYIVNNYLLDYTDTEFTVYIWLNASLLTGSVTDAVFDASIGADTTKFTGTILPPQYQQVNYIHFSGAQLINLGVSPSTYSGNYSVEIEESHPVNSSNMYIFGTDTVNSDVGSRANVRIDENGVTCQTFVNTPNNDNSLGGVLATNKLYIGSLNYIKFTVDSTNSRRDLVVNNYSTYSTDAFYSQSTVTFRLGGYNNTAQYIGDVYSLKLFGNGSLVRNLVPCYRRSDGKPGFYDVVGNSFYTNIKTGDDLTAGPNINA